MSGFRRIWWYPPLPVGARVCEIGYGAGDFQRAGQARGWIMSGMDPGRPPIHPACQVVSAEAFRWPVTPAYDAVVAWQVLEHLVDPVAVLQHVRRALRPEGYLVVSMPNGRCLERWLHGARWDGWRQEPENPLERHRWHWDARSLGRLLRATGFRVQRVLYQRIAKQLPGGLVTGTVLAALGLSSRMTVVARVAP